MSCTYQTPSTAIIHEFLHNEVIIANLDTGVYYSLRDSGVPLWQLLMAGYSDTQIATRFEEYYETETGALLPTITNLIQQLADEAIIAKIAVDTQAIPDDLYWPDTFQAPSLERYEEMKDLLMLDPIHEVDEQGWPSQSPQPVLEK